MSNRRWIRAVVLGALWGYVAAMWTSIAHFTLGTLDAPGIAALVAVIVTVGWTLRPAALREQGPSLPLSGDARSV